MLNTNTFWLSRYACMNAFFCSSPPPEAKGIHAMHGDGVCVCVIHTWYVGSVLYKNRVPFCEGSFEVKVWKLCEQSNSKCTYLLNWILQFSFCEGAQCTTGLKWSLTIHTIVSQGSETASKSWSSSVEWF